MVAIGRAEMVKADWVKPGAVVIDCGINSIADSSKKSGYRLVGDVDFAGVSEKAGSITPVPGNTRPSLVNTLNTRLSLVNTLNTRPSLVNTLM